MSQVLSTLGISSVEALLSAIVTLVICIIAIKIVTNIVEKLLARNAKLDATIRHYISSGVRTLLWIIAIIIVANALGINTTSLVALVSVAGLALSLSIQNVMSNLFSGITLLIAKPFTTGDFVEVAGKTGTIKAIGLFYTQMDTLDNIAISIPNADVTGAVVNNYSKEPLRRVDRTFTASYECSTEEVKAAIFDAISKDSRILADPAPFVRLLEYKGSTVEYVVRVWCKNADYWDVYFNLNENVRESSTGMCTSISTRTYARALPPRASSSATSM